MNILEMSAKKTSKKAVPSLLNRYIWLLSTIYREEKITFEEINKKWRCSSLNDTGEDIPLRTFHNHRKAIQELFEIDITCNKTNGYKYYIENIDDLEQAGIKTWLLNSLSVSNIINESHKLKHRILLEKIPSGQKYLTSIIEAMRDNLCIEINYQSFWSHTPYKNIIHPYCIKIFRQRWYVIANNPDFETIHIYALDRILELEICEETFQLPADFNGETFFEDCFGIIAAVGTKAETVKIKVLENQYNYINSLPLHHSQKEIESTDDYSIFSYYIKPTFDFKQELLSHGSDLEVLEPHWLRKEISYIINLQHKAYKPKQR